MRIVVKVGTSTLAHSTGRLNIRHTEDLVKVLSDLKNAGHEVILVSSGAIGMGVGKLSMPSRPGDMATKQACAAVGQCELMYTYDRLFTAYNHNVAQILLTGVDVEHEGRRLNFQNTLTRLLELGALPIINENDTVSTDEITSIGDNDTLAAIVTCCIHADLLVLLSDIDGLYTANPHTHPDAKLIPLVERITPEVLALADGAGCACGCGAGAGAGATLLATALTSCCWRSAAWRASSRIAVSVALIPARSPPHSEQTVVFSSLGWNAPQAQNQPYSVSWGTQVSWTLPVRCCSVLAMEPGSTRGMFRRTRL